MMPIHLRVLALFSTLLAAARPRQAFTRSAEGRSPKALDGVQVKFAANGRAANTAGAIPHKFRAAYKQSPTNKRLHSIRNRTRNAFG